MMVFDLDCGRRVYVDEFHFDRTYGTVIEGRPNRELHQLFIDRVFDRMTPIWGKRETYLIPPVVDETDPEYPVLPPIRMWIWLVSWDPINPDFMASELVVVCFRDEFDDQPLQDVIYETVRGLDWNSLAHDFDW